MKIIAFPPTGKPKNFKCEKAMFIDGRLWLEMTAQQHKHFTSELDGLYLLIYDLLPKENQNVQFSICSPMSRIELYSTDF